MSTKSMAKSMWQRRVVRYIFVGVLNSLTDLAILNSLVFAFNFKVLIANAISATTSIIFSYFWNHSIVFQKQHKLSVKLFLKFFIVTGLGIVALQSLIIFGIEHIVTITDVINWTGLSSSKAKLVQINGAKVVAILGGMFWNYILYHLVVFKDPKEPEEVFPY